MNLKKILWVTPVLFCIACDTNRVFEDNQDMENNFWHQEDPVEFNFRIEDPEISYNLYTNFRNASAYPYHNLYYQYTLEDSLGNEILSKLQNINLFDPKTGEPLGSGLGDLFDHQQLMLEAYHFPAAGNYAVTFQQYMRTDSLPMILSVGLKVEKVNQQSGE